MRFFSQSYLIVFLILCLMVPTVVFAVWWNPVTWFNYWGLAQQKKPVSPPPAENTSGTTDAYGITMHKDCLNKFEDFVKQYGSDYTKCMSDFDFNDQYCGGFDPSQGLSNVNIVVILDASGSMAEKIDKQSRIDIAKKAVSSFLAKVPPGVNTGLVVYGHKGSNLYYDKEASCKGIEEVIKLGQNNSDKIISAMNSFTPKGWTPIAGAFDFTKDIFLKNGAQNRNYLVLVTDGEESCDGDPFASAQNLKMKVPGIQLNIIGFAADHNMRDYLKKVASEGGGIYLTADNSADMAKAFDAELLIIKKDCLYLTFSKTSIKYSNFNNKNLNCFLSATKKEGDNFNSNITAKSSDVQCVSEMTEALRGRQNQYWLQKETLKEKNDAQLSQIEWDFNNQLKIYDKLINH